MTPAPARAAAAAAAVSEWRSSGAETGAASRPSSWPPTPSACRTSPVRMWVHEETLPSGERLTDAINRAKALSGVPVEGATRLVFVTPHQFVEAVCRRLKGVVPPFASAISLIKGMEVRPEGPQLISSVITRHLDVDCLVLMGANIASEVAKEQLSEATMGYSRGRADAARQWAQLFDTPYFHVEDIAGVELCGTLKNIVAIAAGLVDGLGMGNNTKAAIMRVGLNEMRAFSKLLYPTVQDGTFFESCGIADLITTCFGGRNRKVAEAFARHGGKRSFLELEAELLGGQKLQGILTASEVHEVLVARRVLRHFPLFTTVHAIAAGHLPPSNIVEFNSTSTKRLQAQE
eukprot:SM000027S09639  [mRNA]  locus=s27:397197:399956:- [translate_table: standard]